ncbi:MAG: hypothetical protein ACLFPO_08680 [Spirochaetaceae bacterium]
MKTPSAFVLLLIVATHVAFSQSREGGEAGEAADGRIAAHYRAIRSFHPRLEGSEGEERTLSYIDEVLGRYDVSLTTRDFSELEDEHSFSRVATANLPGTMPGRLLVIVPLNHAVGVAPELDGSVSLAGAVALLEELAAERNRPGLSFVFLGADVDDRHLGSRLLLSGIEEHEEPIAAVYLDIAAPGRRLSAQLGAADVPTPRWLAEPTVRALVASGLPRRQHLSSLQVARSPLAPESVLGAYLERGVPTVRIHDPPPGPGFAGPARAELTAEWAASYLGFLERLVEDAAPPPTPSWDRHYIYAVVADSVFFVGERSYLILLLAVLASPIIYGIAFRRRLVRYVQLVTRHLWAVLVLAGLMFLFFFIATAVIQGIMDYRDFPTLWQYAPGSYFLLKVLISVFLFAVVFQSIRGLPFPRNASFYSASAIFLLFFDMVLLSVFDIAFTFYFLWGFLFAFFFSLARSPWIKLLLLPVAAVWPVVGGVEIFAAGELSAAEGLLLSPVSGNLIFAFVLLPFLLMLIRIDLMFHRRLRLPHGATLRAIILGSAAAAVLFASALVFLDPFSPERPQPVDAVEVVDLAADEHRLELSSPAPLEGLVVSRGDASYEVHTSGRRHSLELAGTPEPVSLTSSTDEFLSRSRREILIDSSLSPADVALTVSSPREILIFDSEFPTRAADSGRQVRFAVGPFPPNPLEIRFTVPRELPTRIDLELVSRETAVAIESAEPRFRLRSRTRVLESLNP